MADSRKLFMSDWQKNIVPAAERIFTHLRQEFTVQQIKHIAGALERAVDRAERADLLRAWRSLQRVTMEEAATQLGIAVKDVQAIESETLKVGPEAMRPIRRALRRCRHDLDRQAAGGPTSQDVKK